MENVTVTCVYCGHHYEHGTPTHSHVALTDHIKKCEAHPMKKVIEQRDLLLNAVLEMLGESDIDNLKAIRRIVLLAGDNVSLGVIDAAIEVKSNV